MPQRTGTANHIMFIDPHIDPSEDRYKGLETLIESAAGRSPRPLIELHRVCYRGSGRSRTILNLDEVEATFRAELGGTLSNVGLSVEVFIWSDFHDRYLISNLVGISVPNGFDTTRAADARTTWTRLGRKDRDGVQREFDPAHHKPRRRFTIP
ncbi:MAG: hypothetical protein MJD61_14210 [Proteobacteria bacterium]|nr:hypothetical protein [Pseudomonadota bacterium]